MQLPKLTPLQSRLLTSAIGTGLFIVIWISFHPHNVVYAAELRLPPEAYTVGREAIQSSPNGPIFDRGDLGEEEEEEEEEEEGPDRAYQPDFAYFDKSLTGRQASDVDTLTNNEMKSMEIDPGKVHNFMFPKSQLTGRETESFELRSLHNASKDVEVEGVDECEECIESVEMRKRQNGRQVFISINTCQQPIRTSDKVADDPPQLILYVSTKNKKPGPGNSPDTQTISLQNGFANYNTTMNSDVYIGVSSPSLSQSFTGSWSFQIAASTQDYYHSYIDDSFLFMIDTDSESALFITPNLTNSTTTSDYSQWMDIGTSPFTMYAFKKDANWGGRGLERSYCGLQSAANNNTERVKVDVLMTTRYGNRLPKVQLHVQNLTSNSDYIGSLVINNSTSKIGLTLPNESAPGPGGRVWKQFTWHTKAEQSCQVIFGLDFCADIAYAVPSSPRFKGNTTGLASLYDNQARDYYQNFTHSLAQVACNTTGTAQYSLARTCFNCSTDYKNWLCAVLMPRCYDFSDPQPGLQERNIQAPLPDGSIPYATNTSRAFNETKRDRFAFSKSRNPMIDEVIRPGPYKELLPCEDLCFDIVRSCPATLQFACPNEPAKSLTYAKRTKDNLTCSFPGAVVDLNMPTGSASALGARRGVEVLFAGLVCVMLWL